MYRYRNKLKVFFLAAQSTDNTWNKMWIQRSFCRLKPQTLYKSNKTTNIEFYHPKVDTGYNEGVYKVAILFYSFKKGFKKVLLLQYHPFSVCYIILHGEK